MKKQEKNPIMTAPLKGYNGNSLLKRANQTIEWTKELIAEFDKCSEDPIYFIETYMKIISEEGLVNFKLYDYQKEMVISMANNRFNIITTARQAGKSTTTCGFILWFIIFNSEKTVALLANKGETAREILGKIKLAYEYLPRWLQQGVFEWNKGSFELENNSRVIASATSSDAIRGYAIDLLFIDEAAFIENWDEFFTSVYPTVSSRSSSKIVLVSTPNGLNYFYSIWVNSFKEGTDGWNNYKPIRVLWNQIPGRDKKWMESTLASMNFNHEKFAQEYEGEFQGSSGTLISGWKLKELVPQVPRAKTVDGLIEYYPPFAGRNYVCIADVSRGKGLDYSAFHIIDITEMPYYQVCTFRDNMTTPLDYASIIHKVCKGYNNAAVLVEINDIGEQVSSSLHYDFEYENILFTENAGRVGKRISTGYNPGQTDMGIRTTKNVKALGCNMLKLLIEQNQLVINDFHTISELSTFSRKGNSFEAEEGTHDDLVMGLVLFGWLSDQGHFKEMTDINTLQKLREKNEEELESNLSPFGFVDAHQEKNTEPNHLNLNNWLLMDPDPIDNYNNGKW